MAIRQLNVDMDMNIDKRSKRGKELAARLNRETILENMPKIYYVREFGMNRYRVGRTDWSGDTFNLVSRREFETFLKVAEGLNYPIVDQDAVDDGD